MIDFTVLSAALNKVIMPSITRQMYEKAPAWQLFGGWSAEEAVAKRMNVHVDRFENNKMYMQIRTAYHSGIVNIAPGEKYQYGSPALQETYSQIKTLVGSFQIQKALLNVTNKGAIVKPLLFSSESLANDLAMDANRQVYGLGDGVIATTASSGSTSTTVALASPVTGESPNGDIDFARYFPPGGETGDGVAIRIGSNAITHVTAQTGDNTITIADAQSWSPGANIVKVTGSNTTSSELDGLKEMVAGSGSYQNLDAATANSWKSATDVTPETLSSTVTAGAPPSILKSLNKSYFKANKIGHVKWLVMNSSMFQTYGNALQQQIRMGQKEVLAGGWVGLDFMGGNAQVLLDYDCPDGTIYLLSPNDLVFGQFQPLEWEKGTDGVLFKITQQLDYEVTASWMGNIGTISRAAQAAMRFKTAGF